MGGRAEGGKEREVREVWRGREREIRTVKGEGVRAGRWKGEGEQKRER